MTIQAKKLFLFLGILSGLITACLGLETQPGNHLGWALLLTGAAVTTTGCLYLGALFIKPGRPALAEDRSLWLPILGVLIISLVTPLEYLFLPPVLPRSDHAQDIGLILAAGGLVFYLLSLQAVEKPVSVQSAGPVRSRLLTLIANMLCRPISASLLLFGLGLGIGYSSWAGLLVILVLVLPGLILYTRTLNAPARPSSY